MSAPDMPGWEPIEPADRRCNPSGAVRVSATSKHGRFQQTLIISINPVHFGADAPPAWLAAGHKVWAMRGVGEFAGTIRLMPNGPYVLQKLPRGGGCLLRLPKQHGQPDEGAIATSCEFDFADGWFDITLPRWFAAAPARPAAPAPAPAPAAAAPPAGKPPAGKPFVLGGAVSSHPDWTSPKGRAAHEAAIKERGK